MMKKIKRYFTKSELHIKLEQSCFSRDNFVFKEEDINTVLQFMIDEYNIQDYFDFYENEQMHTYTIKMKMLITIHQIVNVSEEFANFFTRLKLTSFGRLRHCNRNNEKWLLINVQMPFLSYLQKLALNISDIKGYRTCLFRKQIINSNYKLINLMNQALSIVSNLKMALTNYPYDFLLKRLSCIIYMETHSFQRQLINSLSVLVGENSSAKRVEIFEFFRELQAIEAKMIQFYSFNKLFDPSGHLSSPLKVKLDLESVQFLEQSARFERDKTRIIRNLRTSRESNRVRDSPIKQRQFSSENKSSKDIKFEYYNSGKSQKTIKEDLELPTEETPQQQQ